jgi:hypothetical protein
LKRGHRPRAADADDDGDGRDAGQQQHGLHQCRWDDIADQMQPDVAGLAHGDHGERRERGDRQQRRKNGNAAGGQRTGLRPIWSRLIWRTGRPSFQRGPARGVGSNHWSAGIFEA